MSQLNSPASADGFAKLFRSRQTLIALGAVVAILLFLALWLASFDSVVARNVRLCDAPLVASLIFGGGFIVYDLLAKVIQFDFGADLLAGISIVASLFLGEYLAGALVVLMLSGGGVLEAYAVRNASSVLDALARRMPSEAHRRAADGSIADTPLAKVTIGDTLVVFPHEICPVDGVVVEGHGTMDEAYLTGEPYVISKVPGSTVLSGAINGETALVIRAEALVADSRYAKIMQVMRDSEQRRPRLRRLGDQLGALYTPLALAIALAAWAYSGDAVRFLAVLVVATPCPLLIAIPVAILGAISLSAKRGIVIKDPAVLEKVDVCSTAIFDKTGTLTYGKPDLTEVIVREGQDAREVLSLAASLERYSKHPLAAAVLAYADEHGATVDVASEVSERPGAGLTGTVGGRRITVTSRGKLAARDANAVAMLPAPVGGMECIVLFDGEYAATFRFRDQPRSDGASFVHHLAPRHAFDRMMIVSGDRESEVRYLADLVGIKEVYAGQTPEQKLEIVRRETKRANTVFLGDGINDAPALTAATVGIAFGAQSDVTAEAAGAVILENSIQKVDELLHISRRLRRIALGSAVGGMALSVVGMGLAAVGLLPPVAGAIMQEAIDVLAVLNALRMSIPTQSLSDY